MTKRKPTIVIDTYGGASAPQGIVAAAARMARQGVARVVLVGDVARMQEHLSLLPYDPMTLRLVGAPATYPRVPGDTAAQARAARLGLPVAMELLQSGEADALVTASPQSLVLELAELHLAKLPGLTAVAAAAVFPTMPRASGDDPLALLLDVSGRRATSAAELVAFAVLGSTYSRVVTGVREPHVALLSTGADPNDGPPDIVAAHQRLKRTVGLRFMGNITATDLARGHADVVVAVGLVGHTVRGLLEGLTTLTVEAARYAWRTKVTWQLGLRLLDRGVGMLRKVSEFQQYGGAPVLGLQQLVLIASPDSAEVAFENAVKLATRCTHRDLQKELATALAQLAEAKHA